MAVVYMHRKLSDYKPFYIGIGNDKSRASIKSNRSQWWKNIANKHGYFIDIVMSEIDIEEAIELEMLLISEYGRMDLNTGVLCNQTDGGDGVIGSIVSDETKEKLRIANSGKNSYWYGKKQSKEVIDKKVNSRKGYRHSEETKKKIGARKGNLNHNYGKLAHNIRPIEKYNKKGKLIEEYISITKAEICNNIHKGGIGKVLSGKRHTTGGFIWKYKKD